VTQRRWIALLLASLGVAGAWPSAVRAVIPSAARIAGEVADANRSAGRSGPVLLDVTLTLGDGPIAATGVLATHPTGLARLELQSNSGFVERHLLQGNSHSASRDGVMLDSPRQFLPPVFLLQATSGAALRAALVSFGVEPEEVVLGRIDDFDCYVLGGRLPRAAELADGRLPSIWIDLVSFDIVRVDGSDGVRYRFGPSQDFDGIRVPRWIAIEADGQAPARLDIVGASAANAPAAAFGLDWLTASELP
jgi:hypothetical protein